MIISNSKTNVFLVAFLLIVLAMNVYMIFIARCIAGFCTGIITLALPVYLGETIQSEVRGVLGLLPTSVGNLGMCPLPFRVLLSVF